MRTEVRLLLAAAAALVGALLVAGCQARPAGLRLEVYGFGADAVVQEVLAQARQSAGGADVQLRDLSERGNGERFTQLIGIINVDADIPLLPNSVERRTAPPYVHYSNQNRYYSEYLSSLTAVTRGRSLLALVLGASWYGEEFWHDLLQDPTLGSGVALYLPSGTYRLTDQSVTKKMSDLVFGQ